MIHYGLNVYSRTSLESEIAGATPHQLITLLLQGARSAVLQAKIYCENGNIAKRGEKISKAINIIDTGLNAALDHRVAPEISGNLARLYEYMSARLIQANMTQDVSILSEVGDLLKELTVTWQAIDPQRREPE